MSMCRGVSYVVGKGCLLWPVHSLGRTVSLCPASFWIPRQNLAATPDISWLPSFAFQSPMVSPLDCKEIQPVSPKGSQSLIFIGRTDAEAETPVLWLPDAKNWLIWKDPDAGKDWRQEEKGTTEDEMVGWHHQLDGHGLGWSLGFGDGQGGLVCWNPWGC